MRIEELPFDVDIFVERPGRTFPPAAFFLTHAHADHLTGLAAQPSEVHTASIPIYCTTATAALASQRTGAPPARFRHLALGRATPIPDTYPAVTATAVPANHCLGACMLLFDIEPADNQIRKRPVRVLHTGDFRFSPDSPLPFLARSLQDTVDVLYLDVTYGHPFPPQRTAIASAVAVAQQAWRARSDIFIGGDTLGKEELFAAIASALQTRVVVDSPRYKTIAMADPILASAFFSQQQSAPRSNRNLLSAGPPQPPASGDPAVRLVPWWAITSAAVAAWSLATGRSVFVLLPTACPERIRRDTPGTHLPYSSHSSFNELRDFVRILRPRRVAPTPETSHYTASDGLIRDPAFWFHDLLLSEQQNAPPAAASAVRTVRVHDGVSPHFVALTHGERWQVRDRIIQAGYSDSNDEHSESHFCSAPRWRAATKRTIMKSGHVQPLSARLAALMRPAFESRTPSILRKSSRLKSFQRTNVGHRREDAFQFPSRQPSLGHPLVTGGTVSSRARDNDAALRQQLMHEAVHLIDNTEEQVGRRQAGASVWF
jgi:DNA cross-link repair 1A protein